jgi:hypothetical protein
MYRLIAVVAVADRAGSLRRSPFQVAIEFPKLVVGFLGTVEIGVHSFRYYPIPGGLAGDGDGPKELVKNFSLRISFRKFHQGWEGWRLTTN